MFSFKIYILNVDTFLPFDGCIYADLMKSDSVTIN